MNCMRSMRQFTYYDIGYFLAICGYMVQISFIKGARYISLVLEICAILIFIAVTIRKREKFRVLVWYFLILSLFAISAIRLRDATFIIIIVTTFAYRGNDFDNLVRKDMYFHLLGLLAVVALYFAGLVESRDLVNDGEIRHSLGFSHPNNLGAVLFCIAGDYFYFHYKKNKLTSYFFYIFLVAFCWFIPRSRTCALLISFMTIVGLFVGLFKRKHKKIEKLILYISTSLFFVFPFISYYFPMQYGSGKTWISQIDTLLSHRIYLSHIALEKYQMHLFGNIIQTQKYINAINVATEDRNLIDNAYVYIGLNFGIIALLFLLGIMLFIYIYALRKEKQQICYCILFVLIYAITEQRAFNIGVNIFVIYFLTALQKNKPDFNVSYHKFIQYQMFQKSI